MDASLNSSKSNRLPKWNPFFQNFAQNQYLMYQMIYDDMENLSGQDKNYIEKVIQKEMFYNIL